MRLPSMYLLIAYPRAHVLSGTARIELTVALHIQSGARSVYLEVLPHDDGTIPERADTGGTRGVTVFCIFICTTLSLVRLANLVASDPELM